MRGWSLPLRITREALNPLVSIYRTYLDPGATVLVTVDTFGFPGRHTHRSFHLTDVCLSGLMITTEQSSLQQVLFHLIGAIGFSLELPNVAVAQ